MKGNLVAPILLLTAMPAIAHRLDEYLQGTIITVEKNRVQAQMTLTAGVAVYPIVLAGIDANKDGVLSDIEQKAYAERVLRDLSLSIDGHRLAPRLASMEFPAIEAMREGRGEIRIEFDAELPRNSSRRRLVLENNHQSRIAAYQVNCLVPRDPDIQIVAQNRNYLQSHYELDYMQAGVRSNLLSFAWWSGDRGGLAAVALLLFTRFIFLCRQRRLRIRSAQPAC